MGADIDCFRELIQVMQSLLENDIHFAGGLDVSRILCWPSVFFS